MNNIIDLAFTAFENSESHGFWDGLNPFDVNTRLAKLALITSEIGEAVEAVRVADEENFGEELADIVIRVFDLAVACGIPIGLRIRAKNEKNASRPHMHGGKLA